MIRVIKVGGAIVENEASLAALLDRIAAIEGPKILVHGGGRSATALAERLGVPQQMVDGRRITDAATLDICTMVYAGSVNKHIVAGLEARGVRAVGLTGADMSVIRAHRRPVRNGVDYGFVGDVDRVDATMLLVLTGAGAMPVLTPLCSDGAGGLLNTNADTIASATATALAAAGEEVTLTYCFEKPGVLRDADDDSSVISEITADSYERLKADGTVSGGMLPKLDNAFAALAAGVRRVIITDPTLGPGTTIRN